VSGAWRAGSLLLLDDQILPWRPRTLQEVVPGDFQAVIDGGAALSEFVLLGTGPSQALPPRSVREALQRIGLGLEFMSTEGAARTYGVLMSEGRRVAVALIAV
jgi:uncharacterized protein